MQAPIHPETGQPIFRYSREAVSFRLPHTRPDTDINIIPQDESDLPSTGTEEENIGDNYFNYSGNIPPLWEEIEIHGVRERKNDMRGALSPSLFYTIHNNTVYAGNSARDASLAELQSSGSYHHAQNHPVYLAAPRGLPRTPGEARGLIQLIRDVTVAGPHRIEAYYLVLEILSLAHRVASRMRDRTMRWVLTLSGFDPTHDKPILPLSDMPSEGPTRDFGPIMNTEGHITVDYPSIDTGYLNVDAHAEYLLFHHHPGSPHYHHGVIFDQLRRSERRSVFTHIILRMLCQTRDRNTRRRFAFFFTLIAALPHRYHDAITHHNQNHPARPFTEQTGPVYHIHAAEIELGNLEIIDINLVLTILIDNGIPTTWIETAYTYALRTFEQAYRHQNLPPDFLDSLDDDRIERLTRYGEPPALDSLGGWRTSTPQDTLRLTHMFHHIHSVTGAHPAAAPEWLTAGINPAYTLLKSRDYGPRVSVAPAPLVEDTMEDVPIQSDTPFAMETHVEQIITAGASHTLRRTIRRSRSASPARLTRSGSHQEDTRF